MPRPSIIKLSSPIINNIATCRYELFLDPAEFRVQGFNNDSSSKLLTNAGKRERRTHR